jgi:hypothetical protein
MTPFEQAVAQAQAGTLKSPEVSMGAGKINYFQYQLAVHKYYLSLMSKGIQNRQVKLKDLKQYYGLKGKTAADCLPQFLQLIENFTQDRAASV